MDKTVDVIVKVGKQSNIILSNTQSKRAITLKELKKLTKNYPEYKVVILENIKETEYNEMKQFISDVKLLDKHVYFYVPDNHDITCGLADELIYNIYLTKESLFNMIETEVGLNIRNDITLNINPDEHGLDIDSFDSAFDRDFSTDIEYLNRYKDVLQDDIELPTISSKDDVQDFFDINTAIDKMQGTEDKKEETKKLDNKETDGTDKTLLSEYYSLVKDRDTIKEQLQSALNRIQHVTELNEALIDEKNTIKNILDSYNNIDDIEESDEVNSDVVEELNDKINELNVNISIKDGLIEDLRNDKEKLENEISSTPRINSDELNNKITNLRVEVEYLRSIAEKLRFIVVTLVKKISEINVDKTSKAKQILELTDTIEQLNNQITLNNDRIQKLENEKEENKEKITNYDAVNEQVEKLTNKTKEQSETISKKDTEINELKELTKDVDTRVELARNYAKQEINEKDREIIDLQGQLNTLKGKLTAKEIQYDNLVNTTGLDSSGATNILENSKMMDEINKTLREQIVALKGDIDRIEKDRGDLQKTYKVIEEQNKQYKVSILAMSSSLTGYGTTTGIPAINYIGKGMIIPVFGSGSYGITTTAMSIATKLAAQSRVLYIDFDMVSPKADIWFKINPIVKNIPGYNMANNRATGLGLLVDKQIQYFLEHASKIITRAINTKGGSVDYISGFYVKPEAVKLVTTDFSSFLNYCGNNYTYTVIDFGRLGSSDVNDQIIKVIADIAYRNVVVTTSEKLEIRTFRLKINDTKIDINNIAWLINMCTTTGLEASTKKLISPAEYGMVPLYMDMYGNTTDFNKERITRDKFQLFLDKIVFKQ